MDKDRELKELKKKKKKWNNPLSTLENISFSCHILNPNKVVLCSES
jgi:hypothetical protein